MGGRRKGRQKRENYGNSHIYSAYGTLNIKAGPGVVYATICCAAILLV